MADHNKTGTLGEKLAVDYLLHKGYEILETNWRSGHKEIDIIAKSNETLVIAEVKTRRSKAFEQPFEAVNDKKQEFLIDAAEYYLEEKELDLEVRFDIISIYLIKDNPEIDHIENAFSPLF